MARSPLEQAAQPKSIHARWVANVEPKEGEPPFFEDQVVTIGSDGRISGIVPRASFEGSVEVTLESHLLIPGLVNCHSHSPMAILRGYADDHGLQEWLFQHIFPTEGNFLFGEEEQAKAFIRAGTKLAVYEMLKTGTTLFNDMYFRGMITAEVVQEAGLRAVLAPQPLIVLPHTTDDAFTAAVQECVDWGAKVAKESSGRIYPSLIPHSAYTVPEAKLLEAVTKYNEVFKDSPYVIHTHAHETQKEVDEFKGIDGKSAIQTFDAVGMLRRGTVCAHCVAMTDEEIDLFAARGVSVAHNPRSNLKLGSGIARIPAMLEKGVNVCLGTDGAASNNGLDMLSEMQYCSLLAKGSARDAQQVPALQALQIATINGARALNLDKDLGSIAVGKFADLVAVDLGHLECAPVYDPLGALVFTNRRDVSHVWVNGKTLVKNGEVLTMQVDVKETQELVTKIHEFRASLPGNAKQAKPLPVNLCKCCGFRA